MPDHAFRDRPINDRELEMLRLTLSSFRDGSGQNQRQSGSMPGFRDYERSLAAVLGGVTTENRSIFDVLVPAEPLPFGVSCKMASMPPATHKCSFMEMSNAAAQFREYLLRQQVNWATEPMLAGPAILDLVSSWHLALADLVDLSASRYAVLAHDGGWVKFQLLCFPLNLKIANPKGDVDWRLEGKSVNGYIDDHGRRHRLWQLYMTSGGQLKYYPLLEWADWVTPIFALEAPPIGSPLDKAKMYFPDFWPD